MNCILVLHFRQDPKIMKFPFWPNYTIKGGFADLDAIKTAMSKSPNRNFMNYCKFFSGAAFIHTTT